MSTSYNVQAAEEFIIVTLGDTIDLTYSVDENGSAYDMTDMQLDMDINNKAGTTVKALSSAGVSPAITISTDEFNIATTAFSSSGTYYADLQVTDGTDILTIVKFTFLVERQIT